MSEDLHRSFRLLPSEHVLWHGAPQPNVPRSWPWIVAPGLCFAFALVAASFAALLHVAGIAAVRSTAFLGFYLFMTGVALWLVPAWLVGGCRYVVTDRQLIWKRGQLRRAIELRGITYGRIHWHRSVPGIGTLELVRAAPFGPFARVQRIVLADVEAPDRVFALIRGAQPGRFSGYCDVPLTDRLDANEQVLWGAAPDGLRIGRAELVSAALGGMVCLVGVLYVHRMAVLLMSLERAGLRVRSVPWSLFVFATLITASVILGIGATVFWKSVWGARALGSCSEYVLTATRVLIRRGRTELSIARHCIVDVVEQPGRGELSDLYLIVDAVSAGAAARVPQRERGLLGWFAHARSSVPPILYEVRERELFRQLLFADRKPQLRDVA